MMSMLRQCLGSNAELVNTQEIDLVNINKISIAYIAEKITFFESDTDKLILKEYMGKDHKSYYARITKDDGEVKIKIGRRPPLSVFYTYVEVFIPTGYTKSLEVLTISGKITFLSSCKFSEFKAKSTSGSISFPSITAEKILIKNQSGKIDCGTINGGIMKLTSTSGSIYVKNCSGSGKYYTETGRLELNFAQVSGDIDASVTTGEIILSLTKELSGNIDASVTTGSINLSLPKVLSCYYAFSSITGSILSPFSGKLSGTSKSVSGTVGKEPVHKIRLSTMTGRIEVNQ